MVRTTYNTPVLKLSSEKRIQTYICIQVLPTVHAASDRSICASSWAHCSDNVVMVMFGEAVHQQALILCQLPELQGTCTGPSETKLQSDIQPLRQLLDLQCIRFIPESDATTTPLSDTHLTSVTPASVCTPALQSSSFGAFEGSL